MKTIRSDLKEICGKLQKAVNNLPTNTYQTKGSAKLYLHAQLVVALFNSAENNLVSAHKAANALGSIKSNPKASKLSFNIGKYSASKGIMIKAEDAMTDANAINTQIAKLESLKGTIDKCYKEIDSLNVTEQFVSSLTVVDFLFPINGASKYVQITMVKNIGTTNLKQAKKDVGDLINYFKNFHKVLTTSINQFAECEKNVKSKIYEKAIATTSTITENSNTPVSEMKDKIDTLEKKQAEYEKLYGEKCPEIEGEIARLKKLYEAQSIEGKIKQCVENAIENDKGNGGKKYMDWCYDNYKMAKEGWCDRFVVWLLGQMGIQFPIGGCDNQMNEFKNRGGYYANDQRSPQTGDVVFFDWDGDGSSNHVGVIYINENGEVWVIHGNYSNKVCYQKLSDVLGQMDGSVIGYGDPSCL